MIQEVVMKINNKISLYSIISKDELLGENLPQCQFFSHINIPGIECGPPQQGAGKPAA
jgi:hypothetical protein